jgi:hypothetical protein
LLRSINWGSIKIQEYIRAGKYGKTSEDEEDRDVESHGGVQYLSKISQACVAYKAIVEQQERDPYECYSNGKKLLGCHCDFPQVLKGVNTLCH